MNLRAWRNVVSDLLLGLAVLLLAVLFVLLGQPNGGPGDGLGLLAGVRLACGLLGVLLVPGYTAAAALFPNRSDIDPVSRGALALGLSVAAVPLTALLLNQTTWGIRPVPMALALLLLTALLSAVAVARRLRSEQDLPVLPSSTATQFSVTRTQIIFTQAVRARFSQSRYTRPLLLALLAVTAAILAVGAFTVQERGQESFSEFYLLGSSGKLSGYPYRVLPGQPFEVTLGVRNRERLPAAYTVESAGCQPQAGVPMLQPGQEWQGRLRCRVASGATSLDFTLLRGGSDVAYRHLTLKLQPGE